MTEPGPHPVLRTRTRRGASITLRPGASGDEQALVAIFADPESQAWTTIPLEFDLDRAKRYIENAQSWWHDGTGARWVLADADDACVGLLDLRLAQDDPQAADLFFISAPTARGNGYMSAAVRAVVRWAIVERGMERIEWRAVVGNEGSRRVALAAGFRDEGIARRFANQRGRRHDTWVASFVASDLAG